MGLLLTATTITLIFGVGIVLAYPVVRSSRTVRSARESSQTVFFSLLPSHMHSGISSASHGAINTSMPFGGCYNLQNPSDPTKVRIEGSYTGSFSLVGFPDSGCNGPNTQPLSLGVEGAIVNDRHPICSFRLKPINRSPNAKIVLKFTKGSEFYLKEFTTHDAGAIIDICSNLCRFRFADKLVINSDYKEEVQLFEDSNTSGGSEVMHTVQTNADLVTLTLKKSQLKSFRIIRA